MKKLFAVILFFLIIFAPCFSMADVLEYQNENELVVLTNLIQVEVKDRYCYYIDITKGYAKKNTIVFASDQKIKYRVISASKEKKIRLIQSQSENLWNGEIRLVSGEKIRAAGLNLSYSLSKDRTRSKRYSLFKNNQVCMTDSDMVLRKFYLSHITEIQFFNNSKTIGISLLNGSKIRGTFFCAQGHSKRENFVLSGIETDRLHYFEIPMGNIDRINPQDQTGSFVAEYK